MLKGRCPGCEAIYFGWALQNPDHQWCECGDKLQIENIEDKKKEEGNGT